MRFDSRTPIFSFLLALFLLFSSTLASAIPAADEPIALEYRPYSKRITPQEANSLAKRAKTPPVPTVEDCKAQLSIPKDKAVFYTSIVEKSAEQYATANGAMTIWTAGLTQFQKTLQGQIKQAQADGVETWDPNVDPSQFFINCSKAFALLASGEVTAVLPAGKDGKPSKPADSYFTDYEWPILQDPKQTPDITRITAFVGNKDGSAPSGDSEELCRSS